MSEAESVEAAVTDRVAELEAELEQAKRNLIGWKDNYIEAHKREHVEKATVADLTAKLASLPAPVATAPVVAVEHRVVANRDLREYAATAVAFAVAGASVAHLLHW